MLGQHIRNVISNLETSGINSPFPLSLSLGNWVMFWLRIKLLQWILEESYPTDYNNHSMHLCNLFFLFACLFICLAVDFFYPSFFVDMSIWLTVTVCLFLFLSDCLTISFNISTFDYMSNIDIYLSLYQSKYLYIYVSTYYIPAKCLYVEVST